MAGIGSFTTVQHGDAILTYIHVPSTFKSIPSGSYFVPACIAQKARRDLLGRLDQRPKAVQLQLVHVNPTDLSLLLAKLGVSTAICTNVSRGSKGTSPLVPQSALDAVRVGLPWPEGFPPHGHPEIQIPQPPGPPPPPAPAPAAAVRCAPARSPISSTV
jgi:hypothetical protein